MNRSWLDVVDNKVVPSFFLWSSNKHRIPLIGCEVYGNVYSRAAFNLANG